MIELMFLKELILIKEVHQKSAIFVTIGSFQIKGTKWVSSCIDDVMNLSDIAPLNINGVGYCCIIRAIRKSEARKAIQNIDLTEKTRTL